MKDGGPATLAGGARCGNAKYGSYTLMHVCGWRMTTRHKSNSGTEVVPGIRGKSTLQLTH